MNSKEVVAGDSENEFEVDELEEVIDHSDDEYAPTAAVKTPSIRGQPAKSTPASKNMKPKVSDDEDEEEILPKKERGSKPKTPTPEQSPTSARGWGRATNELEMEVEEELEEESEEEPEEDEELEEDDENVEEEDDEYVGEEEEELNQVPNLIPANKFTSGAFIVLKTDMIDKENPPVWKIDGSSLLQKYIPFNRDENIIYKSTSIYTGFSLHIKDKYYSAPITFIQKTRKEHIIEFHKDKIEKEEATEKELEEEERKTDDNEDEMAEQDEA